MPKQIGTAHFAGPKLNTFFLEDVLQAARLHRTKRALTNEAEDWQKSSDHIFAFGHSRGICQVFLVPSYIHFFPKKIILIIRNGSNPVSSLT